MIPPCIPTQLTYTPNFCEENVYCLARYFTRPGLERLQNTWSIYVVFISNEDLCITLLQQKGSKPQEGGLIVWDYHCILVLVAKPSESSENQAGSWVYDVNSLLDIPVQWYTYVTETFPFRETVPSRYRCKFRVVDAQDFLAWFASDRSHMLIWDDKLHANRYVSKPPEHLPIIGSAARVAGITNNLMDRFVLMQPVEVQEEQYGRVMDQDTFCSLRCISPIFFINQR
ncbi:hypothetical protein DACRYDRAFT_74557 [Dacryopinax primogenitus]|uniref:Protein N-terminal glutamine amidohydrolase n=1 Tax=Dacryopinax primogenitus (strain DJM 731) TaxID=1858805 RepID=M5GAH4_DACPD|nr:uncharacterized protein DACRYDRAFT_74557 [Dacryopinax primogenitus]EJU05355.1 hypothetical protein DACRYDRAFT_74557 [Dacryopinax primogenitus]